VRRTLSLGNSEKNKEEKKNKKKGKKKRSSNPTIKKRYFT
jgi:hypothetical protein